MVTGVRTASSAPLPTSVQTADDVVLVGVDDDVALRVHRGLPSGGAVARTHRRRLDGPTVKYQVRVTDRVGRELPTPGDPGCVPVHKVRVEV